MDTLLTIPAMLRSYCRYCLATVKHGDTVRVVDVNGEACLMHEACVRAAQH